MKINQRHMLPRIKDGEHLGLVRRGPFLDGTRPTFYGPGQPPDAGWPGRYAAPTDWNKAGTLLRVPQVVWLTVGPNSAALSRNPDAFHLGPFGGAIVDWATSFGYVIDDHSTVATNGIRASDGSGYFEYYDSGGALIRVDWPARGGHAGVYNYYDDTVPNPWPAEYDRLWALFGAVKARIEALRPGRTFVALADTANHRGSPHQDTGQYYFPFGSNFVYWYLISPVTTFGTDSYFGTDFLHVYCGTQVETSGAIAVTHFTGPGSDAPFDAALSPLRRTDRFRRFAVRLFSFDLPTGQHPHVSAPTYSRSAKPSETVLNTTFAFVFPAGSVITGHEIEDPWGNAEDHTEREGSLSGLTGTTAAVQASLDAERNHYNSVIDEQNTFISNMEQREKANMQSQADYLASTEDLDYAYQGASRDLTEDGLVRLIAEHYGFNPDTGADLPPG